MAFTGKCTYTAATSALALPEIAEDVSDVVGIVSPFETPLLDALGDPHVVASNVRHEWLESALLPNFDTINDSTLADTAKTTGAFVVANLGTFRVGDLLQPAGSNEMLFVVGTNPAQGQIVVARGYGSSTPEVLTNGQRLNIVGNAALEGQDAEAARFSIRQRLSNFTQIFSAVVQVSGTEAAVRQLAVEDEMDFQKTSRLRELLRDLENTVINGIANNSTPLGNGGAPRTMHGIMRSIQSNIFTPSTTGFPTSSTLTEEQLNLALRKIWESASSKVDLILVGGAQKRKINSFITTTQRFSQTSEYFKNLVSTYESDFGVCRVVMSRYVPADAVVLLDSSRVSVVPLIGRSFQFIPLAPGGDYVNGEVLGEYTLELKNETAHGMIRGLATS